MTTETKHEELRELHEAATPGPWYTLDPPWLESGETSILAESPDPHVARWICDFDMCLFDRDDEAVKLSENPDEDARLIVHLRNNVEHYIAQDARIAELEAENARLREAFNPSVLRVMGEMTDYLSYPAGSIAADVGLSEKYVRNVMRALHTLGLAEFGSLHDEDSTELRGRGYWLNSRGVKLRAALGEQP